MTSTAVIGLGEAGALYARGLRDAGYTVSGFDPFTTLHEEGIRQEPTLADAVATADLVISLVGARAAEAVGTEAMAAMSAGAVFADLNTGSPDLKRRLEAEATSRGILAADVAVLAPVPRAGVGTPLMVSGTGASRFTELFAATGADVESIGGAAGDAASRKLVRSVFMKGLAAVVLESVGAAEAAGCETWLRAQIAAEFAGDPAALVQRLIDGSRQHAGRRAHEVADARDYLDGLGRPSWVTSAAHRWFGHLLEEAAVADPAADHEGARA
ncbi:NAD(P)-binding domain-containing protein [Microbacterium sp. TNHR37B]|uniref:NAD(P)-binding domain-containing protein n=1 Tax=Microbacterium sp. TNHR37B TaxID=1775956 RepID=UPI0007B19199|nr:NAD(P)-dependent oxidoreductase [Microbacterium sp. TNHR37B]KZE89973.1 3-sulfolactaldehyde reductase [Microbacterium sp. TNHR37B]